VSLSCFGWGEIDKHSPLSSCLVGLCFEWRVQRWCSFTTRAVDKLIVAQLHMSLNTAHAWTWPSDISECNLRYEKKRYLNILCIYLWSLRAFLASLKRTINCFQYAVLEEAWGYKILRHANTMIYEPREIRMHGRHKSSVRKTIVLDIVSHLCETGGKIPKQLPF